MYTNLDYNKIKESVLSACDRTGIKDPKAMLDILDINTSTIDDDIHIEEITKILSKLDPIDSNNNQYSYYDRYEHNGLIYTVTTFPNGEVIIDETLPIEF